MGPVSIFLLVMPKIQSPTVGPTKEDPKPAAEPKFKFSSVQCNLPEPLASKVKQLASKVKDEDINKDEAADGKPGEIHCTALYGLTDPKPDKVEELLKGFGKVKARLGEVGLFETDKADVLKIAVESRDLQRMNKLLRTLPHENDYPDFKPHVTLAYLKPGKGKDYLKVGSLQGESVEFAEVEFSSKDGIKHPISLLG